MEMCNDELDAEVKRERTREWQGGFTEAIALVQKEHNREVLQLQHQNSGLRSKLAELQIHACAAADDVTSSNKVPLRFSESSLICESNGKEKGSASRCNTDELEAREALEHHLPVVKAAGASEDAPNGQVTESIYGQDEDSSSCMGEDVLHAGRASETPVIIAGQSNASVVQFRGQSNASLGSDDTSDSGNEARVGGQESLHFPIDRGYRRHSGENGRTRKHMENLMATGGLQVRNIWSARLSRKELAEALEGMQLPESVVCNRRDGSTRSSTAIRLSVVDTDTEESFEDEDEEQQSCVRNLMIVPTSFQRVLWDVLTIWVLGYDVLAIPLMMSFDVSGADFDFFTVAAWITAIFWTTDITMSLRTGIYIKDRLVTKPGIIARNYVRSWAIYDFCIVGLDWSFIAISDEGSAARLTRVGKFIRAIRFLRMLRLLRILKARTAMSVIVEQLLTEVARVRFKATKIIIFLMVLNHLIACLWYSIGTWDDGSAEQAWVYKYNMDQHETFYRYCVSMQWSIANFGVGSSSILYPGTLAEHIFAIIIMMIALIVFSTIVSTITNSYSYLQQVQNKEERDFGQLRTFFRQNDIPKDLGTRIQRYVQRMQHHNMQRLSFQDLELLNLASEQLRAELQHQTFQGYLLMHKVLRRLCEYSKRMMHKVSSNALSAVFLACGDFLFYRGEVGDRMFFIPNTGSSGTLEYISRQSTIKDVLKDQNVHRKKLIRKGYWISEAAIWCPWIHVGSIRIGEEVCEIVAMDALTFASEVALWPAVHKEVGHYATAFVKRLNKELLEAADPRVAEEISANYDLDFNEGNGQQLESSAFPAFGRLQYIKRFLTSLRSLS